MATEVKQLAQASARSAEEVAERLAEVQSGTKSAVDAIGTINTAVEQVTAIHEEIASIISAQSTVIDTFLGGRR
ncbi:hypothetical protein [Angustibacter luteus]|uniref:Methyl-accepting chemotaxis protein n=1 Tax=Angustibacter luteus TaxID=658456 RepID=A0ABW1JF29_9ACTN